MRAIRGVVMNKKGKNITIRLETGLTIHAPQTPGLLVGKKVLVAYDFTSSKIKQITLEVEHQRSHEITIEEPTAVIEHEEEITDILDSGFLDSGALPHFGEGFWDSGNLDSGILELSEPKCEDCEWHDPQY